MVAVAARFAPRVRETRGQALVFVVIGLTALLVMAAFVVDVGYLYWNQRNLQASADAAALAGAEELPDPAASVAMAQQYGTGVGGKNRDARVSSVDETVGTRCLKTIPGCTPVNAVVVDETAHVSTFFMRLIGRKTADIHVRSTACSPCGVKPLDVMLVLDRTGSMCQDSLGNPDPACTDLNNAKNGIRTFLSYMDSKVEWVGLAVLPPAPSLAARCGGSSSNNYNSKSAPYAIVPLSSDFKLQDGSLNPGSNLVSTLGCVRGGGTTAYANAIEAAQAQLDASGRPNVQDVIVFLSDGAANTGPTFYSTKSPYRTQPCHQGITSAGYSKSKGTIVYSIGYALDDDTGGCASYTGSPEAPAITVYQAMQGIASDPSNFYNKPDPGQLNTIYTKIAADISRGTSALISDNTP